MLTFKTISTRLTVLLAAGTLAAACGDNSHGGSPIDAPNDTGGPIDSGIDSMTDGGNNATTSGTLAVTDVTLQDPSAAAVGGINGGSISISFSKLDDDPANGGNVLFGTSPVNGCVVTEFTPTSPPHDLLDAGAIAIASEQENLTIAASPTGAVRASNVVTITTTAAHRLSTGVSVTIAGVTDASFDGTFPVASTPTATTFTYTQTDADATSGGGTAVGTSDGFRKTVGPCVFVAAAAQYLCVSNSGATQTVNAQDTASNSVVAYTFQGACTTSALPCFADAQCIVPGDTCDGGPFVGENLVGSYLQINGMAGATPGNFDSGASAFPILAQPNARTLAVINPAPGDGTSTTALATASYTVLNGFAPIPTGGVANPDFLGTGFVTIQKAANSAWPAINTSVDVPAQGWTLSDSGDATTAGADAVFPSTAADTTYGCGNGTPTDSADDTCGDTSTSLVQALIVSGRATLQDVGGTCDTVTAHTCTTSSNGRQGLPCAANSDCALLPFQMPTEVPGTDTWIEWQCAYIGAHSGKLPSGAVQAILDANPTRVEVRVINAAGAILQDGANSTNLLVGHGFVRHTDSP